VLIPVVALLVAMAGYGIWQTVKARRVRWVQQDAIPEIERLQDSDQRLAAVRLARQAEPYAPDAIQRVREAWLRMSFVTEPEGAEIAIKDYLDPDAAWEPLGTSPIHAYRLPLGAYRVRATKAGFTPLEVSRMIGPTSKLPVRLTPEPDTEPGMVLIAGGPITVGVAGTVTLPDFWMDKLEVTNRAFKQFVDAGGYRDEKYWRQPFRDGSRLLTFNDAISRFRDSTGRAGPATWDLGSYPEGQADFPVAGISWFEAAAYARFAGKSLPSLYHWYRAAPLDEGLADILRHSNIDGKGLMKAGERQGLGPWGTLDMAGNVKEWCENPVQDAELRYILGGGWDEPSYRFYEADARNPWERLPTYGVRRVKNLGPSEAAGVPVARVTGDPQSVVPVSADRLEIYKRFYAYDRTPLAERLIEADERAPHWRKETVSFDAAYAGERIPAYLFLPRNVPPPYQTIVLFPSAYSLSEPSSQNLDLSRFDFIVRSGRALLYPVYQGTYERRKEVAGASARRDLQVQWAKDFFRAVDYLETRRDIDTERLAYYSLSMGAFFGPIPV
jgi:formylglycine-generating enzyme required for sulfatase activity